MLPKASILALALTTVLLVAVSAETQTRSRSWAFRHSRFWKYGMEMEHKLDEPAPTQWFTQKVDHFDTSNTATWQQKYFVNVTNYKFGGPLFVIIGGEGPNSPSSVSDHFVVSEYAQQFGALLVSLEHRYYGDSYPVSDLSTPNMKYLTSKQALADLANFILYIRSEHQMEAAKVVTFGGSYSGALSAWFRLKYPEIGFAAFGTSAPVEAILDFHRYAEIVGESLGTTCAAAFRSATSDIEKMIDDPTGAGKAKLSTMFNTCSPMKTSQDATLFLSTISDTVCGAVQYSGDNTSMGRKFGIPQVCDIMLSSSDYVAGWAKVMSLHSNVTGETCLMSSWNDWLSEMRSVVPGPNQAMRSWTWQTCVEFGYFQAYEGPVQPFSQRVNLQYYIDMCYEFFGQRMMPDIAATNKYYGGADIAIQSSRIILPNGSLDPWHALGSYVALNPTVVPIFIQGTAHCADMYPPMASDPVTLTMARKYEDELLFAFLSSL